ncbi:hypothetical protein ANN_18714 [Periplaneta americana]|uniref:Uncharacterized protein n=1 Tax=Periplaneta americana TaxID=6978 RepID=A0ABQ8SR13_PERAM|nr:hypothetical protein ANN_18714 [Periplaneta americana]
MGRMSPTWVLGPIQSVSLSTVPIGSAVFENQVLNASLGLNKIPNETCDQSSLHYQSLTYNTKEALNIIHDMWVTPDVRTIQKDDKVRRMNFALDMLYRIDEGNNFLQRVLFCDEVTFHLLGHVNRHSVRIWGSESSHIYITNKGKKWNSLHYNPQLIPDLPRKSSVAPFRLATGHDCLAKHLHRIGIYQSPNCPLCNSNQEMDLEHLKICASVADHDNIFEKYWSARGQMTLLSDA